MLKSMIISPPKNIWSHASSSSAKITPKITLHSLMGDLCYAPSISPSPKRLRFSKSPNRLSPSPLKQKESTKDLCLPSIHYSEKIIKLRKIKRDHVSQKKLQESIEKLPQILASSENLIKRISKETEESGANSYINKINTIIDQQKMESGSTLKLMQVSSNRADDQSREKNTNSKGQKWRLRYSRKSVDGIGEHCTSPFMDQSLQHKILSSSMIDDVQQLTERAVKNIEDDISDRISEKVTEKSKLECLLQKISYVDKSTESIIQNVKDGNINELLIALQEHPELINKASNVSH